MPYRQPTHGFLDRIIHIDDVLRRGAPANCTTLAKALEVSPLTILRDIAYLRDRQDRPIEFDSRHHTYRYTAPVGPLAAVRVREGDVFALLVAQRALEQYRGTPFYHQLAVSFAKLTADLKEDVTFSPTEDFQSVSFKNFGSGKTDLETFNLLTRGVRRRREVRFDYRKPGEGGITARHVQPYHLTNRDNLWYLVGFDHERGELRTFALPRILHPVLTDAKFTRPADFSPEEYFASALSVFGGVGNYRVIVRFTGATADRVREREWHESQKLRDLPDGALELEMRLGALPEVERWILQLGVEAEAIAPKELRANLARITAQLAKKYRD